MATSAYMQNRVRWTRPQGLLFSDNAGTLSNGLYIPNGDEGTDFIILSDHNREPLSISAQRIESRKRMINGTMRSYFTADKVNVSTSWNRLPSRAFSATPVFDNGVLQQQNVYKDNGPPPSGLLGKNPEMHTADGGAGGADLLEWYESHPGPFWVFLSYDKFGEGNLNRYTKVLHMYFASFEHTVEKRGTQWGSGTASGYDMWNISMALEEV